MRRRGQPEFQVVHKRPVLRLRAPDRPAGAGRDERGGIGNRVPAAVHAAGDVREAAVSPPPAPSGAGSFFAGLNGVDIERLRREADEMFADLPDAPVRQARAAPARPHSPADASTPVPRPAAVDRAASRATAAPDPDIDPVFPEIDPPGTPEASGPPALPVADARSAEVKQAAVPAVAQPFRNAPVGDMPASDAFVGVAPRPVRKRAGAAGPKEKPVPETTPLPFEQAAGIGAAQISQARPEAQAGETGTAEQDVIAEIDRLRAAIEIALSERDAIDRVRLEERRRHSLVRSRMIETLSRAAALLGIGGRPIGDRPARGSSVQDLRP